MSHEDLMKMLGLAPKKVPHIPYVEPGEESPELFQEEDAGQTPISETVLSLDEWDRAQGEALLNASPEAEKTGLTEDTFADLHAAAYQMEPEFAPNPEDTRREQFVRTLLESPEGQALRESTVLNKMAAEMAAVQFGGEYATLLKQDAERREKNNVREGMSPKEQAKEEQAAEMACIRAASKAISKASEEVEEMEDTQRALGMGPGQGGDNKLDPKKVASLFKRVKDNTTLRKIINLAGRYRRVAQAKQRMKSTHGYDDVVGVELAGEVGRLLPVELAKIADEELELDTLRRLVEKETQCREFRGVERVGKGPIVVCVDESGSMNGEPVANAKAFALAMAWVARHQKRWCCLIGYSGGTEGTLLSLPPGKWDEAGLLDWLEHFFAGGTDMDIPLAELPGKYWASLNPPKGKTDLIILSDAICQVPEAMRDTFLAWKKREEVRCISLIIGQADAGDLKGVSDEVHLVKTVALGEQGIEKCLSI